MANRLQKTPLAVYTPAVRAVAARPAYCTQAPAYGGVAGLGATFTGGNSGGSLTTEAAIREALKAGYAGYSVPVYSPSRPRYTSKQVCYPAVQPVAAVPSRTDYVSGSGWNAGARSIDPIPEGGFFRATLAVSPIATMVGVTRREFVLDYAAMPAAIVVRPSGYTIVERGISVTAELPFPPGGVVELQRLASGRIAFLVAGEEVYVSTTSVLGEAYAGAMLYSLQDTIDSPELGLLSEPAQFSASTPSLVALVADAPVSVISASLPSLRLDALLVEVQGAIRFSATMPRVASLTADRPLVMVDAELPAPTLVATLGRTEASTSGILALIPPPRLDALLMSGGTCSVDVEVPRIATLVSDRHLAMVRGVAPIRVAMMVGEPYLEPGFIDASDAVVAVDRATLDTVLVLVALDSLDVSGSAELTFVLELSALAPLGLSDSVTFGQLVELLAIERVAITSDAAAAQRQALQYAVNALTGAPTTYDGFDFLSFATVDGVTYGVRADGLYQIGDSIGADELISALVDFGTSDFSDAHVKRMETAYLGLRTDGQAFLRVRADVGTERVYRVLGQNNVRRSSLGKGIAGRSWTLKLELVDASFAEVDSLELAVGATQRRGFGSRTR